MRCEDLTAYLDTYLDHGSVPDYKGACNGLQVETQSPIKRIAVAVDACQYTIERAAETDAQMLLVHHGLFWGPVAPLTGRQYRRISTLIRADIGVYSSHLPLDVHLEVGNNHVLARQLGISVDSSFGTFEGLPIGVCGEASIDLTDLADRLELLLGARPQVMAHGPKQTKRIGIMTGGGGSHIGDAFAAGCDTYITGEGAHHTYFEAEERGMNLIYAGHYATETIGVKALAAHIEKKFGIEWFFIDHPTGL